jgi:hypothetical protein
MTRLFRAALALFVATSPGAATASADEPVRCVYSTSSSCALVFVQESAKTVATFHRDRFPPRTR